MTDVPQQQVPVEFWFKKEKKGPQRAFLVGVYLQKEDQLHAEEHLRELELLTTTYDMPIAGSWCTPLRTVSPATFLSSGKLAELRTLIDESGANVIIFDDEITPVQQRNLEREFKLPVMERSEVILGVFASHARTHEAQLQIALAQAKYMAPRLKRLWTHLSRQTGGGGGAGGGGYLKGAGEKQIEVDRRTLKQRVEKLEKELKAVRAIRHTQKIKRARNQVPVFAIVGYTNSGKSTLMNQLTKANVLVENKLFATLDTTTRQLVLPNHQSVLLSDTVGFIRKLPHLLVASFKSTLEEAVYADFLIHVIDASHPQAIEQAKTTLEVLHELKAEGTNIITLLNKIDVKGSPEGEALLQNLQKLRFTYPGSIQVSARTGEGIENVQQAMMDAIQARLKRVVIRIPQKDYHIVSEILQHATVFSKEYEDNDIILDVELPISLALKYSPTHSKNTYESY